MMRRRDAVGPPAATPAAAIVAAVLAGALIALGILSGREFLVARNIIAGRPWLRDAMEWLGRFTWKSWLLPVAIAATVLGATLLLIAVLPRGRRHVATTNDPVLWLRPTDLARTATAATLRVPGVAQAHTTSGRRRVTVHVVTKPGGDAPADRVQHEVIKALAYFGSNVRVCVDTNKKAR